MKIGSLYNQTSPKHWTHHGPAPPLLDCPRSRPGQHWSNLGSPSENSPAHTSSRCCLFFILKNYFQAIKRISVKQWQWIEQVVFYSRKYSLLMLVYGINSKTEKEGEKWKSKETINHLKSRLLFLRSYDLNSSETWVSVKVSALQQLPGADENWITQTKKSDTDI